MKQFKVEGLVYYSKLTRDKHHIIRDSVLEIQEILDEYASKGWSLVSTDKSTFGTGLYIHIYFEKEL